ncbi:cytochrome P450 [Streptomyces hesseae]|uniref:Cytochrome P450 n=1 Tax=Streptomyces hesseae TaxID=3075519 RepID=A0ABU2SL47_9ACTN|nr:cytochrome P450 [Streptomyces sp. DSM 40473]MDT0449074.1 cytochrome P450 [Streptomyces sp. DSM 40473]
MTRPSDIPTVPGLPVVGSALDLALRPHAFLSTLSRYGDLSAVRLGPTRAFFVSHPDLVHQMLVTDADRFVRGRLFQKIKPLLGEGLVMSEGAVHRRQRRMVCPAFRHSRLGGYAEVIQDVAERRLSSWTPGRPVDLVRELQELGFDVASNLLFSDGIDPQVMAVIRRSFPTVLASVMRRTLAPTDLLEKVPTRANRAFATASRELHEAVDTVVARYRERGAGGDDLFSALLAARDESTGRPMTDRQLHDEVVSVLTAGGETTGTALTWCAYFVSHRPEVGERLRHEADTVLHGKPARYEHLADLSYTQRVATETVRLYPPVWMLTRQAVTDTRLGGHTVPADSTLFHSSYAIQRDPRFFTRPHDFDPDRWLPERVGPDQRHAYMPFGRGIHGCVGERVGWMELVIVLSTIARLWRLAPVPGAPVRPVFRTNVLPRRLLVIPEPR